MGNVYKDTGGLFGEAASLARGADPAQLAEGPQPAIGPPLQIWRPELCWIEFRFRVRDRSESIEFKALAVVLNIVIFSPSQS